MSKYRVLGIIPARAGSKRIPSKNKKKLAGKELVRYVIEASLLAKQLDSIILSSDDAEILEIGKEYNQINTVRRPAGISRDKSPAIEYVHHALDVMGTDFTHVCIIQPSSPFTISSDIDSTIKTLLDNEQATSSVSVMKLDHSIHPAKIKMMDLDKKLNAYFEEERNRMATHELPDLYVRNGSVYVSAVSVIQENKIIGTHCLGYEMPRERSIDINDPLDFEFAEFMMVKKTILNG